MKLIKILTVLTIILLIFIVNKEKTYALDCVAPIINGAQDIVYEIDDDLPDYLDGITVTDTCQTNLTASNIIVDDQHVDLSTEGHYPLNYYLSDELGQYTMEKIYVDVFYDITEPVITFLPTQFFIEVGTELNEELFLEDIMYTDNKDNDLTVTVDFSTIDINTIGTYSVTFHVLDDDLNEAIETRSVEIVLSIDTIILQASCSLEVHTENPLWGDCLRMKDDYNDQYSIEYIDTQVDLDKLGIYYVNYVLKDKPNTDEMVVYAGSFSVIVEDTTKPIIEVNDLTLNVFDEITDMTAYLLEFITVTDNYDDETDILVEIDKEDFIKTNELGNYEVIVTATDKENNTSQKTFFVYVVDNEAPNIEFIEDTRIIEYIIGDEYPIFKDNVIITDNYDVEILSENIKIYDNYVNYGKYGTYPIIYRVEDSSGNYQYASCFINVRDNELPIIEVENELFEIYRSHEKPNYLDGVYAINSLFQDITDRIIVDDSLVNYQTEGDYPLRYIVCDLALNVAYKDVTVRILIDSDPPIINGAHDIIVPYGTINIDYLENVFATDFIDYYVEISVNTNYINLGKIGSYDIIYTAVDKAGNVTTVVKKIIVQDTVAPKLTGVRNLSIKLGNKINPLNNIMAIDNYDGNITDKIEITGAYNLKKAGTYKITVTVTDTSGNVTSDTFTLTVEKNNKGIIIGISIFVGLCIVGSATGIYLLNKDKTIKSEEE